MIIHKGADVEILERGFQLSRVKNIESGNEYTVRTVDLKERAPSREEKYHAQVSKIRQTPLAYFIAGWIASHESNIHVSTPPKDLSLTIDELSAHGVDFDETTLTQSTDATQGRSYSVVTENHGKSEQLFLDTEIISTLYHGNQNKVSMQAKQFILDFLLDELKFQLGKVQDTDKIRKRIPVKFLLEFELGLKERNGETRKADVRYSNGGHSAAITG